MGMGERPIVMAPYTYISCSDSLKVNSLMCTPTWTVDRRYRLRYQTDRHRNFVAHVSKHIFGPAWGWGPEHSGDIDTQTPSPADVYINKHATLSDSQYPLGYLIHSFSLRGGRSLSRAGAHTR